MIKASNIIHYYNNDIAINDISIEFKKGEFSCLIGESGSGKSTLLSILSTLLKPTNGNLFYENENYNKIKDIDIFRKNNIGFIFQFHYLINYLNIEDNLKIANEKASKKDIYNLLELFGIEKLYKKYPNEISGGEKQRASIARALINSPSVIFADEPTGNLDSMNSLKVFEIFKELSKNGTTIIVATHDKNLAQIANTIYEVKDGKLR